MCNPLAVTLIGTAISAGSAYQQGQAQGDIAKYQARNYEYQAQSAREAGAVQEQQHRDKVRQLIGSEMAAAGASGADVQSQSFGKIMEQSATMGELDAQTIRTNALREAYGFTAQAAGASYQGEAAKLLGKTRMVGTALTGFAKVVDPNWFLPKKDINLSVIDAPPYGWK